ncbi:hypothetical protein ACHQM5_016190 [Ranunculus cassubicifolius]
MAVAEIDNEDKMSLAQFSHSRRRSNSPKPLSKVFSNQAGIFPRENRSLKNHDKAKQCARERAEEIQANLDPQFPSFVKTMVPSHVSAGFWLTMPRKFCIQHLLKQDSTIILVDEDQTEYETELLVDKHGLTGLQSGWKGFVGAHELVEGDALVFQLVEDTRFQVYIIRAYCLGAINGVKGLLTMDSCSKQIHQSEHETNDGIETKRPKRIQLASQALQQSKDDMSITDMEEVDNEIFTMKHKTKGRSARKRRETVYFTVFQPPIEVHSRTNSEVVDLEAPEGVNDVQNAEYCFTIYVNGVIIDSEISVEVRRKYCELCSSRGVFLHNNLVAGLNVKFAAGAISETVDIADSIRASKLITFQVEFEGWEKSLGALEQLGMDVGFLTARLQRLKSIVYESEADSKEYGEAQVEKDKAHKEIQMLRDRLAELEKGFKMFDFKTETLKAKTTRHEDRFQLEANSPW